MESTSDNATLRLPNAINTQLAGSSLAETLYTAPLTVFLSGELGVGKTTFLQGFAKKLGIKEPLTSPTYALEQRYQTERHGELIHLDLFRLSESQAEEVSSSSEDHEGIRCIEWSDRLERSSDSHSIFIEMLEEENAEHTRTMNVTFKDIPLPSSEKVETWRKEVSLQPHIIEHCEVVADFTTRCANVLTERGMILRPLALQKAAQLHDLMRFFDFHRGINASYEEASNETQKVWEKWKQKYPNADGHESACAAFLQEHGYPELAEIVTLHGLGSPNPPHMTIEQKLLFYADKRVKFTEIVTLEERFRDFNERYENGEESGFAKKWYEETIALERELFEEYIPF